MVNVEKCKVTHAYEKKKGPDIPGYPQELIDSRTSPLGEERNGRIRCTVRNALGLANDDTKAR